MKETLEVSITQDTEWIRALNAARTTWGKPKLPLDHPVSPKWEKSALLAEHSVIKLVEYTISFKNIKQWATVHLVRHGFTLPFVHSQRPENRDLLTEYPYIKELIDLFGEPLNPRDYVLQGETNDMDFVVNAQTLINISRKRLCRCASKETREAWELVKSEIQKIDPVLASVMVPNCVYSGFCREMKCCGYCNSKNFEQETVNYRNKTL